MRKTASLFMLLIATAAAAEVLASYAIFRYYAHDQKAFRPEGSATAMLTEALVNRIRGTHPKPALSIDHSPLFTVSDDLGFTLVPGRYRIKEVLAGQAHVFNLTVTAEHGRTTSYYPVPSNRRLLMSGDSSMFGWGLDDEQTIPWLIQARLPNIRVVNLSLTSYSTIHALLQMRKLVPRVGSDDVVVIEYHQLSNQFNVESIEVLQNLKKGFEVVLGDGPRMRGIQLPFGVLDGNGRLAIQHVDLSCTYQLGTSGCSGRRYDPEQAMRVTMRVFDAIMDLNPGHLVIVFMAGGDNDPVIAYLRSHGATIADLRTARDPALDEDFVTTDGHAGPFSQYQAAQRLLDFMYNDRIVALPSETLSAAR